METTDFGGLQHTVQVRSLKVGTEIPNKQRKKIRKFLCRFVSWRPYPGATEAGGALWEDLNCWGRCGSPQPQAPVDSALGRKVFAAVWGGPAFFLCCGKEDHWADSKEDEVVWGGRCGFSAYLSNLFQQEMKAAQIRCWLPHWHCPGLQLLQLRLRADLKRT